MTHLPDEKSRAASLRRVSLGLLRLAHGETPPADKLSPAWRQLQRSGHFSHRIDNPDRSKPDELVGDGAYHTIQAHRLEAVRCWLPRLNEPVAKLQDVGVLERVG